MNIILDPGLEQLIEEKVASGEFDSADAVINHALRTALGAKGHDARAPAGKAHRPVSEIFDEIRRSLTPEEREALLALPSDFAAEHDHYLYGTPKKYS